MWKTIEECFAQKSYACNHCRNAMAKLNEKEKSVGLVAWVGAQVVWLGLGRVRA